MRDETEEDKRPKPLLELAREKFKESGGLTDAETLMFKKTELGKLALCGFVQCWTTGPDGIIQPPLIHASRIEWLCTDNDAKKCVTHKGIHVEGVRIEGELDLECVRLPFELSFKRCAFEGDIDLMDAEVRGLYLNGSHAKSITADRMKVDGSVHLRNGFSAQGEVRLLGASIGGNLECDNGKFSNPKRKEDDSGMCLSADGVKVDGSVFLRDGFSAQGEVRLLGASIGGDLDCDNGKFSNESGDCLSADGVKVAGSVLLRNGFSADGLMGFTAAKVTRHFQWHGVETPEKAELVLRSAKVGTLWDEEKSWPGPGKLYLHGLVYDEIYHKAPVDAESRIKWLGLQPSENFSPQPYEQLAKVLKNQGFEEEAKDILVAKNKAPGLLARMSWRRRAFHKALGLLTGYGYRTWRPFWIGVGIILLGWAMFGLGFGVHGVMAETKYRTDLATPSAMVYSIDLFVPMLDLRQAKMWEPAPLNGGTFITPHPKWTPNVGVSGCWLRVYMWFHIAAGWVLTTLFIVGLTGLMRS